MQKTTSKSPPEGEIRVVNINLDGVSWKSYCILVKYHFNYFNGMHIRVHNAGLGIGLRRGSVVSLADSDERKKVVHVTIKPDVIVYQKSIFFFF